MYELIILIRNYEDASGSKTRRNRSTTDLFLKKEIWNIEGDYA